MKYELVDVTEPENGKIVSRNKYWLCKDGDPKQALFYRGTAQCNQHKEIPEMFKERISKNSGWNVEVVFLEIAFRPIVDY